MTNSTKAYCTILSADAEPTGVAVKLYTHSAEGKFLAVGWLYLTEDLLKRYLNAVAVERDRHEQPMLPPWDVEGQDNVKWLPPQP